MKKLDPPVLTDPESRKRYDERWATYGWEHPQAYWIRGGEAGVICTRCGVQVGPESTKELLESFVGKHLECPLGHGFDSRGTLGEVEDPLFAKEEAHAASVAAAPDDPVGERVHGEPEAETS